VIMTHITTLYTYSRVEHFLLHLQAHQPAIAFLLPNCPVCVAHLLFATLRFFDLRWGTSYRMGG